VHFTGIQAAKSDRGQVFTFTFQNPEDNSVKEKQATSSRIPARFSPTVSSQAARRRGSVPSETNQPDNLEINSGPPGDVPRVRPTGRALNPVGAGATQANQISQSENLEEKTAVNVGTPVTVRSFVVVRKILKPVSKTRPRDGQSAPETSERPAVIDGQGSPGLRPLKEEPRIGASRGELQTAPERPLLPVVTNNGQDFSSPIPNRPLKEKQRFPANLEENGGQGLQTLVPKDTTVSPAPPRVRYVKAGSLRFIPNRPRDPQDIPRDFAEPTPQTLSNEDPISNSPERPVKPLRPGALRLLPSGPAFPQDLPPEPTRNFAEPTLQTLVANEEQDFPKTSTPRPPQPGPARFVPNNRAYSPELPPEILRDFANANLQSLLLKEERIPGRVSSTPPPEPSPESLRFVPNQSSPPEGRLPQAPRDFASAGLQRPNEGRDKELPRPYRLPSAESLRYLANHPEISPELTRQILREFSGPTSTGNDQQVPPSDRSPGRTSKPGSLALFTSVPLGLPPPQEKDFVDPNLQALIENQRQSQGRLNPSLQRPSQPGPLRLLAADQEIPSERVPPPGRDSPDANGRRVVFSQPTLDQQFPQNPDAPLRLQPVSQQPDNSPERIAQGPNNPSNLPTSRSELDNTPAQPVQQPSSPPTTAPDRVQSTPIPNPRYIANPQPNGPRLIIEFPSPNSPGDSSIRLQLNPNTLPTNSAPAVNSQPNTPKTPVESSTPNESTSQLNQQALPGNGAAINPPSNPQILPQLPTAIADLPARSQLNQQALLSNAGLANNAQTNSQALLTNPGAASNAQSNQALLTSPGLSNNAQNNNQAFLSTTGAAFNAFSNNKAFSASPVLTTNAQTTNQAFPTNPGGAFNAQSYNQALLAGPGLAPNAQINNQAFLTSPSGSINAQTYNQALLTNPGAASNTQANNQALLTNPGGAINAQSYNQALLTGPGLPTNAQTNNQAFLISPDAAINAQSNNPALLTNAGLTTNAQSNIPAYFTNPGLTNTAQANTPRQPVGLQAVNTDVSNNQQVPTSTFPLKNTQLSNAQQIKSAVQPSSQLLQTPQNPNTQGVQAQLPTGLRNPSNALQVNSQTLAQKSQIEINPLSKTLAFPNQLLPSSQTTRNSLTQAELGTLPNARNLGNSLSRETTNQRLNSQILSANQFSNASFQSSDRKFPVETPTTLPSVSREELTSTTELPNNSALSSQKTGAESKLKDAAKPTAQAPPVDVHLTINFNSNIPGFSTQPQPTTPTNNPQQITPTPPSTIPNQSEAPTRLQLQPVNSGQTFNPSTLSPFDLRQTATSAAIPAQQNFQTPVNFGSTFSSQFSSQPVPQTTPTPYSQFFNTNPGFNNIGQPFVQPTQNSIASFQQKSQFLPQNINSQFNLPGRPFQLQTQQEDFRTRFQPNAQFFTGNADSINSQFNSFNQPSSSSPLIQQNPFGQASPQAFTTSAGLAVNSLSFSPGLSVELLPPTSNNVRGNQQGPTRVEQPRVNFLVNSPELSADLLPPVISQSSISSQPQPSQQTPVSRFSPVSIQSNAQGVPLNVGRDFPAHLLQLLPPIDPLSPQPITINDPPIPIDIPKPAVAALVPPPREQLAIPIDIPKPAVPALVPPPREPQNIPIEIPRPAVPALVPPPRESVSVPIEIPRPDVPALVPPPREHIEVPIDIPRPAVPALVPPPRPSDLARFIPPTPTTFGFNTSNASFLSPENINAQSQTSPGNTVLILPKSSSRLQGRLNPIPFEDLSKKVGFLPQNQPAPFSPPTSSPIASIPTGAGGFLQITDIRAGQVRPLVQEVVTDARSQQSGQTDISSVTFLKAPVHVGLEPPLIPYSQTPQPSTTVGNTQSNSNQLTGALPPTQTLIPPPGQDLTSTSSSTQQPTSTPQTLQTVPQLPPEGFIIFQTPTVTVTSQTNSPDSPINVRVVTKGGTGLIKPNTTLTAEPERPANPQTSLFIQPEGSRTSTEQPFISTTPSIGSSTLSSTSTSLSQRASTASFLTPLDSGFSQNNFSYNPFTPQFSQPFLINPFSQSNVSINDFRGPGTACPKLDLQHKGHRAPQFGGNLILSPGFYPFEDPVPNLCSKPPGIEGKKFNWWQVRKARTNAT